MLIGCQIDDYSPLKSGVRLGLKCVTETISVSYTVIIERLHTLYNCKIILP